VQSERGLFEEAAALQRDGEPFVLVTVIGAEGSTPRNAGARMLWRPTHGLSGTVGGGQFEHLVLAGCEEHFRNRSTGRERFVLGAEAEQCCGGVMEVFFEYIGASRRLVVFGAGHVAHALSVVLADAPLQCVVVDDRPEWSSAERFPSWRRATSWDAGVALAQENPEATLACVMTCSHETDFALLRRLLDEPPAFLGLIGSKSKRVCLFRRLVASGCDPERVQAIHCPIGLGDMGKEPRNVAVSIAGQLLLESQQLKAL